MAQKLSQEESNFIQIRKTEQRLENYQICHRSSHWPEGSTAGHAPYDANGKLLAEKLDNINANDLVISHLRPSPRAPYAVFFPWEPSRIAKVTVGTE